MNISEHVKTWTGQIRTQGCDALWHRLSDEEREEFEIFGRKMDEALSMELDHHWQNAADRYKFIAEEFPAFSDIAIARASHIITEKINRAIRYYNQGVRSVETRQYNKALQYFDLALNVDRNMENAMYNLGMTHKIVYISEPGKNPLAKISAIDTFKSLLKKNPRHAKAAAQIEQLKGL